jgi:signal transduction histidine kinase
MFLAGIPPHAVSLPRNRLDLLIHEVLQVANATRQRRRHRGLLNRTLARLPATSPDVNSREALKEALKESQSRQRALIRELEGAVKLREQFLTIAAHELRTPITALRLSIEAMRRHVEGLALGKLEKMARQERRLTALVEVLLDVSRLQMGRRQLSLEPMDLRETVLELLERFEPERERSGSTFSLEAPTPVPGVWDRLGVEAILSNLIANALKYGRGAAIRVQVLTAGPNAEVRVKDLGIGIAAEDLPKLFAPFVRAVAEKHYGGFGVGLWIARSMAELHGGKVTAKSTLSEGTEFVLELPYAGELPGEVPASSSAR